MSDLVSMSASLSSELQTVTRFDDLSGDWWSNSGSKIVAESLTGDDSLIEAELAAFMLGLAEQSADRDAVEVDEDKGCRCLRLVRWYCLISELGSAPVIFLTMISLECRSMVVVVVVVWVLVLVLVKFRAVSRLSREIFFLEGLSWILTVVETRVALWQMCSIVVQRVCPIVVIILGWVEHKLTWLWLFGYFASITGLNFCGWRLVFVFVFVFVQESAELSV